MLTIENIKRIEQKTLGKKNFYVESIKEIYDIEPNLATGLFKRENERYAISITNRKYAITITLNREAEGTNVLKYDYKLHSSNGNILYIHISDIRNIDVFIDKLRFVALG
jgi:hypothetical protein